MHELDGHRGGHGSRRAALARAQEHHERAQPLAPGAQRAGGVAAEAGAVARGDLGEALLGQGEPARELRAADRQQRLELSETLGGACRRAHGFVPTWMAMIPPAVSTQRTSTSPVRTSSAPSSLGPGKRRTELGR